LIGTKGAFINEMKATTGATIEFNNNGPGDLTFAIQITGNVAHVESMIAERVAMLSKPKFEQPAKHQWLIDKLTAEGTPPERIAQLIAKLPP
jgi:hypothetical protein